MKTNLSISALIVFMALTLILSACGASAPAATATALPSATATNTALPTFTPTVTLTPTRTPKPTATPNLTATQQYDDFFSIVQSYYDAGVLPSLNGKYQIMDDYFDQSIDAGTYRWNLYDNKTGNFIVRADIKLETAPAPASQSGCGFVFSLYDNERHEFVFLQRNGSAVYGLGGRTFTTKYYDQLQNPAEFTMILLVYKKEIRVTINGKDVITYHELDLPRDKEAWGPAMLAGSTQDFGTRCNFTNVELWEISDS